MKYAMEFYKFLSFRRSTKNQTSPNPELLWYRATLLQLLAVGLACAVDKVKENMVIFNYSFRKLKH